jgi:WD40 repeat protein
MPQASKGGLETIRAKREGRGVPIDNPIWLIEASRLIEPKREWQEGDVPAAGCGLETWKRFLQGKKIRPQAFKAFCSVLELDWQDVVELDSRQGITSTSRQDWGNASSAATFFGRTEELSTLAHWVIKDRCRLVAILGLGGVGKTQLSVELGMSGIGKTKLSMKLGEQIQSKFQYVIWRSLLNALPLSDLLEDLIKFLSNQQEANLPESVDERIVRLLRYLKQHRCLLFLDNTETVMQDDTQNEQYGKLFHQVGSVSHQSCLILTSREKPQEIALLEEEIAFVRSLRLGGLDHKDGRKVVEEFASFTGSDDEWKRFIDCYSGNPLALKLAAKHIQEVYFCSISDFLQEERQVFGDLRKLLDWHFNRLSDREQEIMYWLAINLEPVSRLKLREDIVSQEAKSQVPENLQSLQQRIPLELQAASFTLQPVLIEYVIERFINQMYEDINSVETGLLMNYALIQATSEDYVLASQTRLILEPLKGRLLTDNSKIIPKERLDHLLFKLKELSSFSGYGIGNLINLYSHLKIKLDNYDFSHSAIWQADLRSIDLHNVNCAYSNLSNCVFAETIGAVCSVTFSPDGKCLAASDYNGMIRLWQVSNGKQLATFKGHTRLTFSLNFSLDGRILYSASHDETIRVWDVQTGRCLTASRNDPNVLWSYLSSDHQTLVAANDDHSFALRNFHTNEDSHTFDGHSTNIYSINCSSDNRFVASSADKTVKLWDRQTGECLRILEHDDQVYYVAFSPDDCILASGCANCRISLWNVTTGKRIKILRGHTSWICPISFSPDGQILASGSADKLIKLWDINTGECIETFEGHSSLVRSINFSPDGTLLVSGSDDQTVMIWNINKRRRITTLRGNSRRIFSTCFDSIGQSLVSGGDDAVVRLWNVRTGQVFDNLYGHLGRILSVRFSPHGELVASCSEDKTIRLWDVKEGSCIGLLSGHTDCVWSVAFSPDGEILASSSDDKTICLWDVYTQDLITILTGHTSWVRTICFSSNGKLLASGSEDKTIRLWDVQSKEVSQVLVGHESRIWSIAFSPNCKLLASGSEDKTVRLWDADTGNCLQVLYGHSGNVESVRFSPDGKVLASGSGDKTIILWDMNTNQILRKLKGHTKGILTLAFNPTDQTLISGSTDETLKIWDINTGKCLRTLRVKRLYEGMNVTGVMGLTESQKDTLKILGAVEIN